jgi:hypothetical protein
MFNSITYTPRKCEKGVPVKFTTLNTVADKLTTITAVELINNTASITVSSVDNIKVGDTIDIRTNGTIENIFLGNQAVTEVNSDTKVVSYKVYGIAPEVTIVLTTASGSVYSVPNIESSSLGYRIVFSVQSSVPAESTEKIEILLSPVSYELRNANVFSPETIATITSRYTDSSKVFLKVSIYNLTNNALVYTDYQEISCSQSLNRPCQIIESDEKRANNVFLVSDNNWTYKNQDYHVAQFVAYNKNGDMQVVLPSKNISVLPNNAILKFRVTIDPNRLLWYGANGYSGPLSIEDIRAVFYENGVEEDDLENPYSFIVSGISSVDKIKNTPVGYYYTSSIPQPILLQEVLILDEDKAIVRIVDKYDIPSVAKLIINTNNSIEYVGELLFIKNVYYNDSVRLIRTIDGTEYSFCGTVIPINEGLIQLTENNCV